MRSLRFVRVLVLTTLALAQLASGQEKTVQEQAPLTLTLDTAIAMALTQNRDLLIAEQDRLKADAQVGEAQSGAFPQINIGGQYSRNIKKQVMFIPPGSFINPTDETMMFTIGSDNSYQMAAQLVQPLFNRKVGVALQVAKTWRELTDQSYKATEQDVRRQVKKSFYLVLLAKKLVEANQQGLEVVKANYENVQAQFRNGVAAEFDLLRAEVQQANTEPLVISAENNYQLAMNALKNLLSIPLERPILVQGDLNYEQIPETVLQQARESALASNPQIKQIRLQESLLKKNIIIEKAASFPTLSMVGGYSWLSQDNTYKFSQYKWANTLNLGLSLSYPLFDGFRTKKRVQQATIDLNKVHYTRIKYEEAINMQIQATELKMIEARKRISGQEKNIEQAQKAVRIAQTRFKSGVGTQLELLDAQVAMTRSQTNLAQALYDYLVAKAEWQFTAGIL